ncbi:hypothetical protein Plim_4178 [Planctopirus limnophila DSM 3776]|uniref:Uncharacterized protein n=1 Tax=Planctopirus limnophila (strain ATCC 43296 / DSM 3776 / IFAM 1008 / Mu 290) TaxID=521674 RepID=D5SZ86_PLAL2|nr:hypothetical protein [Planctopirus limnophila]ADG69987.1 hypothetical protein Plim_4178 [Planctopirus limnophila DSM 3776]
MSSQTGTRQRRFLRKTSLFATLATIFLLGSTVTGYFIWQTLEPSFVAARADQFLSDSHQLESHLIGGRYGSQLQMTTTPFHLRLLERVGLRASREDFSNHCVQELVLNYDPTLILPGPCPALVRLPGYDTVSRIVGGYPAKSKVKTVHIESMACHPPYRDMAELLTWPGLKNFELHAPSIPRIKLSEPDFLVLRNLLLTLIDESDATKAEQARSELRSFLAKHSALEGEK